MSRETFRRTLRGKGPVSLKTSSTIKRESEILHIAKTPVITMAPTTPVYDAVKIMAKEGFRRIPIANPGTKTLEGIVTATDIIDYLGGGKKFEIIQQKFSGNIFKAINEPIKLVMTQNVFAVKTTARISEAIQIMKEKNVGGLPVIDEEKRVKAIITERDIANLFADKLSGVKVSQIMTEKVATALPKTTIFEAEKMIAQGFRRLPIVADGKVLGIITSMDIIRFFGSGEVFKHLKSGTLTQVLNTLAIEIAAKNVVTVTPDADVGQAAKVMREKNLGALPVVLDEKLVGILTERDFFKIIE
ncbi:MAG: CBS domain-containing protein [Candidatus Bathyarchaeales archaeon]